MQKKDYIELVKKEFKGKIKTLMLKQIDNFYIIENQSVKNKKYKLNDEIILNKNNLMTGFKFDLNYLELISNEEQNFERVEDLEICKEDKT